MKFGDTLSQRSVPEWRSHNLDYAVIKKLIKEHTTPGKGKGVAVPGNSEQIANDLEQDLFQLFVQEHERVSLFVKSKRYEIKSRLDSIERQINHIQSRTPADNVPKNTARIKQRYSRIETEILSVGEQIQNLSRFVSINTLAIRKLLKKYRKWSGSTTLYPRIQEHVLSQPESFSQCKLKPSLNQYTVFLDTIRLPFENGKGSKRPVSNSFYAANSKREEVSRLISLFQGSAADFDTGLEMPSVDQYTQRASYWVHKDNIVELRVLLLQHMRYAKASSKNALVAVKNETAQNTLETEDTVETFVVDDPKRFVDAHNEPVIARKPSYPDDGSKSAFKALWNPDDEATVLLRHFPDEHSITPDIKKVKKKELAAALNSGSASHHIPQASSSDDDHQKTPSRKITEDVTAVRLWLRDNPNARPLVRVKNRRSRFVGLNNSHDRGFWASLDDDIVMRACFKAYTYDSSSNSHGASSEEAFPHAVLTVRGERSGIGLLKVLDQSHLTERVPGFSKEAHAVAAYCNLPSMPTPYWFATLESDIRHIPDEPQGDSRKSSLSTALSRSSASPNQPFTSRSGTSATPPTTTSDDQATAPSLTNARIMDSRRSSKVKSKRQTRSDQRYWSEYDNPDSESGAGDTFYIYVDPDAPYFPGQKTISRLSEKLRKLFFKEREGQNRASEHDGALVSDMTIDQELRSSSSSDDSDEDASSKDDAHTGLISSGKRKYHHSYGTLQFLRSHNPLPELKEKSLRSKFWCQPFLTPLCSFAAVVILVTVCALYGASNPSLQAEFNAALIIGILASLAFAGVALISFLVRRSRLGLHNSFTAEVTQPHNMV